MATPTNDPPDPLRFNVSIVSTKDGTPTPEFLRQWNRQRAVNVTVDDVTVDLTALEDDVTDIQDVDVVAGVGLSGGGNISGPADVTVDLEDTAVTPGTYGNATNSAQITVDQQGRITAATNVPITGGGSGGGSGGGGGTGYLQSTVGYMSDNTSGSAFAFKGHAITPDEDIDIRRVGALLEPVSGADYEAVIATLNGSDEVTAVSRSTSFTTTNTALRSIMFDFASDVSLVSGTTYAIMVGRTDGAGTETLDIVAESGSEGSHQIFGETFAGNAFVADEDPSGWVAGSQVITLSSSTTRFSIYFEYVLG